MYSKSLLSMACAVTLGFAAASAPVATYAQDADVVQQARQLRESGQAKAAYDLLQARENAMAGQPDFDYALALAALDSGQAGQAVIALQRVLAVRPDDPMARAELARAYAMAGDIDTAKAQFETVSRDPTLPDPVRQRFNNLVDAYNAQIEGGSNVTGFIEGNVGHDTNINSATSLTSITIPLYSWLGAGTLSGTSRAMSDNFAEVQGGVSGVKGLGRQNRLFASAIGLWHNNFHSNTFDQAGATVTAGYAHTFASRDVLSGSLQYQYIALGHKAFRDAWGGTVQYTHLIEGGKAFSVGVQRYYLDYRNTNSMGTHRTALNASFSGRRYVITGTAGKEETVADFMDALSNRFAGLNASFQIPLSDRFSFFGDAGFEHRKYDKQDMLFLTRRSDNRLDVSAGIRWAIRPNFMLVAKGTWSRNESNIPLYDYRRATGSVGIRYEF